MDDIEALATDKANAMLYNLACKHLTEGLMTSNFTLAVLSKGGKNEEEARSRQVIDNAAKVLFVSLVDARCNLINSDDHEKSLEAFKKDVAVVISKYFEPIERPMEAEVGVE